jgi:hypothetical protein
VLVSVCVCVCVIEREIRFIIPAPPVSPELLLSLSRLSAFDTWQPIGHGAFGQVYAAMLDFDSPSKARKVCIKTIKQRPDAVGDRGMSFFRELALVHELGPDSPVRAVCVYPEHFLFPPDMTDTIWLVFPVMAHGSLDEALDRLEGVQRLKVLAQVRVTACVLRERNRQIRLETVFFLIVSSF